LLKGEFLNAGQSGEGQIALLTVWQVLQPTERPLKIFVHALDQQEQIIGQWDGLEIDPASWREGDTFVQLHHFTVEMHQTLTQFSVGVYDGETLQRVGEPFFIPATFSPGP
jgi:hypothetical protein